MLRELSVQNLALIEDVRVELAPGYCAWTGETGAGKSLLLTALGLVLGGKSSAELVRQGKDEARASAVFDLPGDDLRSEVESILAFPVEDDQLILTRRIGSLGRSLCHANDTPVTVSTLRQLGRRLIDVHGQHEGRALIDPEHQKRLIDAYGKHQALCGAFRQARESFESLRRKRQALVSNAERRGRELELLRFEAEELRAAGPRRGEFEELAREASRLASAEGLREAADEGYRLLYEDDRSAQGLLVKVARKLESQGDSVAEFADAAGELERLAEETREIAYALRRLGEDLADDPQRLEEVESRLALYRRLGTRFKCPPDDLEARRLAIEDQLASLEREEADFGQLDGPIREAWGRLREASARLSKARDTTAGRFTEAVQAQLKRVSLEHARLAVEVRTHPFPEEPTESPPPEMGVDEVEMVFASNPGEPARPLRKVASGGELSRVTLAIKTVLAGVDRVPTLVFDEVDTGVGGRLGAVLGRNLAELSAHHQIICITHLPQMACFADRHWVIRKRTERGRTRTTIRPLGDDERVDELAAMLRGDSAAEGTRQEALSMLEEARRVTQPPALASASSARR